MLSLSGFFTERSEEPLLTVSGAEMRKKIQDALVVQKRPTVTILSSLLAAQDRVGYLPNEAIEEVAIFTKSTINDVWGVASFYKNFRFDAPSRHMVEVCWGPSCHLVGAGSIISEIQSKLGIPGEGDTPDKSITFRYNTCLGACSQAPVVSIDHSLKGRVDPKDILRYLDVLLENDTPH